MSEEVALFAGYIVAGFGPLATTAALSPLRGDALIETVAVLLLIVVVATATALAGPRLGAAATVTAALSYDFLFIPPYQTLKLPGNGAWALGLLLVFGVAIVVVSRRKSAGPHGPTAPAGHRPTALSPHIGRVVQLIEEGGDERDLIAAVQVELTTLLLARRCWFETGERSSGGRVLQRDGTISGAARGHNDSLGALELPVRTRIRRIGRFIIEPTPGAPMPLARLIVAIILTDHLAAALTSRPKHARSESADEDAWSPS